MYQTQFPADGIQLLNKQKKKKKKTYMFYISCIDDYTLLKICIVLIYDVIKITNNKVIAPHF